MARPQLSIVRRLARPVGAIVAVLLIGTLGYVVLVGMSPLDALYMAVITVTTVGLTEVEPLGSGGRAFTIFLILIGVGAFTYFASSVADYLIEGELKGILERRRMNARIQQLENHFIVCGFGRMGEQVAREFKREGKPLVVIDRGESAIERASARGHVALLGNACDDAVLKSAGVDRARGLVSVVDDDASNLMVTLSARAFNEKLFIVARANAEPTETKLITAGANRVLWPHGLGGRRIAQMALRPNVVEFLEVVMHDEELELWLEEMTVGIGSKLDGCAIGASNIRVSTGANIVAVRSRTGKLLVAPTPDTMLQAGDIVVVLGTRAQLSALNEMTK